jgi:hypothetical protein
MADVFSILVSNVASLGIVLEPTNSNTYPVST